LGVKQERIGISTTYLAVKHHNADANWTVVELAAREIIRGFPDFTD